MAAKVFSGERISNLDDDAAGVPNHDWDTRLPDPEIAAANLKALEDVTKAALRYAGVPPTTEWGPDPKYPRFPEHQYEATD